VVGSSGHQQNIELDLNIDMKEFWEKLAEFPKWEGEGMKKEVNNNMQPMKNINDYKEIEQ
jgi:hypothetical protein